MCQLHGQDLLIKQSYNYECRLRQKCVSTYEVRADSGSARLLDRYKLESLTLYVASS